MRFEAEKSVRRPSGWLVLERLTAPWQWEVKASGSGIDSSWILLGAGKE